MVWAGLVSSFRFVFPHDAIRHGAGSGIRLEEKRNIAVSSLCPRLVLGSISHSLSLPPSPSPSPSPSLSPPPPPLPTSRPPLSSSFRSCFVPFPPPPRSILAPQMRCMTHSLHPHHKHPVLLGMLAPLLQPPSNQGGLYSQVRFNHPEERGAIAPPPLAPPTQAFLSRMQLALERLAEHLTALLRDWCTRCPPGW